LPSHIQTSLKTLLRIQHSTFQNHSNDEASFTPHCYRLHTLTTARQKIDRIQRTEEIIKNYTGQRATYFRFPGICTNAQEDALVESLGYAVEDGTVVAGDPFNENLQAIVNAVIAKATNEATVIMHVGGANAPKSLAALQQIVPQLRAQGYQFATLNDQSHAGEAMSSDRPQPPTGRRRAAPWSSPWSRLKARQQLAYIRGGGLPRRYSINTARGAAMAARKLHWRKIFKRDLRRGDPLRRSRFPKTILLGGDDDRPRRGRAVSAAPKRARARPIYARWFEYNSGASGAPRGTSF
jgi:hypothetical protein